ncbi:hypothetical protein [Alicyclobacillus mengziensis]|uniref:Uncharacterized protein n=1 Tax=Alicyclobacillus mengziensis TaxID=2931921 RepID=A0A9X7W2H9_9BACL|nr:hypothetical protein [Alicyclobacillus mengziensis]QSO49150.1 hypothetical protein JZ786_09615 [Alicyclobacillus mengziensis]
MYTHRHVRPYIGKHVQCHTHFGTFEGIVVHCTKEHLILMPAAQAAAHHTMDGGMGYGEGRPFGMGPWGGGPAGPGGPMGPGGQGPAGPGGGWHFAIPLAAILGITAVGMHWW